MIAPTWPKYLDTERWPLLAAWWSPLMRPWAKMPTILVLHCGSSRSDVASYLRDPTDKPSQQGAVKCKDGLWRRQVCTHAAWLGEWDGGQLVQCSSLHHECWGTGIARRGAQVVQRRAIHVELPGPPAEERPEEHLAALRDYTAALLEVGVPLEVWLRHSDIDDTRHDPGSGVHDDWADGLLKRG